MSCWVKLRLLRGSLDGDTASASAEVRHLASVPFSTSTLMGVALSLSLLKMEARFAAALVCAIVLFWPIR
jgi:hypothetical protein